MSQDPYMAPGSSTGQYEDWLDGFPDEPPDPPERRCYCCDRRIISGALCPACQRAEEQIGAGGDDR